MALTHSAAARNGLADYIDSLVPGGNIVFQTSGNSDLVEFTLANPAFDAAGSAGGNSDGVMTLEDTPITAAASGTGTAAKFRLRNSSDTDVVIGTITATGMGGDIEIDNTSIASGQDVELTSLTYAAPA